MAKKKKLKLVTYLCGPMEACKVVEAVVWRDRITPRLLELDIKPQDPCVGEVKKVGYNLKESKEKLHGYKRAGKWDHFDSTLDVIIYSDILAVHRSDFIIALLDFKIGMGGTICELWTAFVNDIPILAVDYDPISEANSWVLRVVRANGIVFPNFSQLLQYVEKNRDKLKRKKRKVNPRDIKKKLEIAQQKLKQLKEGGN